MKRKDTRTFRGLFYHIFVLLFSFVMIYPLLWMVMGSFKEKSEIITKAESLLPGRFMLDNYISGWKGFAGYDFALFFKNSFFPLVRRWLMAHPDVLAYAEPHKGNDGAVRILLKRNKAWETE